MRLPRLHQQDRLSSHEFKRDWRISGRTKYDLLSTHARMRRESANVLSEFPEEEAVSNMFGHACHTHNARPDDFHRRLCGRGRSSNARGTLEFPSRARGGLRKSASSASCPHSRARIHALHTQLRTSQHPVYGGRVRGAASASKRREARKSPQLHNLRQKSSGRPLWVCHHSHRESRSATPSLRL